MYPIVLCAIIFTAVDGAKILGVFMTPSFSHQVVYQPIWRELSLRGHQVTVLTPNPLNDPKLTNLTEIDLSFSYQTWESEGISTLGTQQHSITEELKALSKAYFSTSEAQLSHPEVIKFLKNSTEKFDLLLVEFIFPIMYAFKDVYKCPMIGLTSIGLTGPGFDALGNPRHPAINPEFVLPFSGNLSFKERVISTIFSVLFKFSASFSIHPKLHALAKKHFGSDVRRLDEIGKEVSLIIVNSNYAISNIKPTVPAYVEISGIHMKPKKQLPKDLRHYLDNAKEGVIYFSLGSNVKSNQLPRDKLKQIMEALAELPFKVLWKFENSDLPNKPKNVEIRKWLPQQDLLGHPNIKAFVFQGGLQSFDEAIYNQVPLLAIPFFADQRHNAHRITKSGAGLSMNFHSLNKEELRNKIIEVATNPSFKERISKLKEIAMDQPTPALEKAVWWIEYVLRHNGAPHLRYEAVDMPSYKYYLLDVIGFVLFIAYVTIFITRRIYKHVVFSYSIFRKFLFEFFYARKSHYE